MHYTVGAAALDYQPAYTDAQPVRGIDPVDGWTLCSYPYLDGDGFESDLYVARAADGDVSLDVSRFRFTPTQERFAYLVGADFPSRPGITPWDDEDIDRGIARAKGGAA